MLHHFKTPLVSFSAIEVITLTMLRIQCNTKSSYCENKQLYTESSIIRQDKRIVVM